MVVHLSYAAMAGPLMLVRHGSTSNVVPPWQDH